MIANLGFSTQRREDAKFAKETGVSGCLEIGPQMNANEGKFCSGSLNRTSISGLAPESRNLGNVLDAGLRRHDDGETLFPKLVKAFLRDLCAFAIFALNSNPAHILLSRRHYA